MSQIDILTADTNNFSHAHIKADTIRSQDQFTSRWNEKDFQKFDTTDTNEHDHEVTIANHAEQSSESQIDARQTPVMDHDNDSELVLFDLNNTNDNTLSKEERLVHSLFRDHGVNFDSIKAYDLFLDKRVPEIIANTPINLENGTHVVFTNVDPKPPYVVNDMGQDVLMYPQTARDRQLTYSIQIRVDFELRDNQTGQVVVTDGLPQVIRNVKVCEIPVMLGSRHDNLIRDNTTDSDLIKKGECPHDPNGYFIVNGEQKVILMQEMLRVGRIFTYHQKVDICKLTSLTMTGSTENILFINPSNGVMRLRLFTIFKGKQRDICVLQAFMALGMSRRRDIMDYILSFAPKNCREIIRMKLSASYMFLSRYNDDMQKNYQDIYHNCIFTTASSPTTGLDPGSEVHHKLTEALFSFIDIHSAQTKEDYQRLVESKKILLALMVIRFSQQQAGLRGHDDRDSYINKRIIGPAAKMEQLFIRLWKQFIGRIIKSISAPGMKKTLSSIKQVMPQTLITSNIVSSFVPNNWGPSNMTHEMNVTDTLNESDGVVSKYDQLLRINIQGGRKGAQAKVRNVQISQLGYVDAVATPSGDAIGLVKCRSVGCWISVTGNTTLVNYYVNKFVQDSKSDETNDLMIINGMPVGWCNGDNFRDTLVQLRRSHHIPFDSAIVKEQDENILYIYTDPCRPTRPFLIVDENNIPLIDRDQVWDKSFDQLLVSGHIEYLDPWEAAVHANICPSLSEIRKIATEQRRLKDQVTKLTKILETGLDMRGQNLTATRRSKFETMLANYETKQVRINAKIYTHVDIDPNLSLGITAAIIPYIAHNPAPRNNYQCNMGKQALGSANHSNRDKHFPTTGRSLCNSAQSLASTQIHRHMGLDTMPAGQTVMLAVLTHANNEEDALIMKREFLERGGYDYTLSHSYSTVVQNQSKVSNGETSQKLMKPVRPLPRHRMEDYENIDENGIVRKGALVKKGDCLICKVQRVKNYVRNGGKNTRRTNTATEVYEDKSVYLDGEDGLIDDVQITLNSRREKIVRVRVVTSGRPIEGDKLATRAAQKSTIGEIVDAKDMPFTAEGVTPDILLNPHALPKRMTMATLLEQGMTKYAAMDGSKIDATSFRDKDYLIYMELLELIYGYSHNGNEEAFSFNSGELKGFMVGLGPQYYQLLKHQVLRKYQVRGEGARQINTRQAVRGRKQGGGVRLSEQDRDGMISHGISHMLNDRTLGVCDLQRTVICVDCGCYPINNPDTGLMLPCDNCGGKNFKMSRQAFTNIQLSRYMAATGAHLKPLFNKSVPEHNDSDDGDEDDQDNEEFDNSDIFEDQDNYFIDG